MNVIHFILRSSLAFLVLLALTRLMGKKHISQLTFFDYITGISIGSIAAVVSIDKSVNIVDGLVGLAVWAGLTILLGYISLAPGPVRKIIDGEPTVVIQNGRILERNMKRMYYNMDDLLMQLRNEGVFEVGEVEFAIMEPNGKLSVLKKSQYEEVTPKDLHLDTSYKGVPSELVVDGQVLEQNLVQNNLTREWLEDQLRRRGIGDTKNVVLALLHTDGSLYVDTTNDPGYQQQIED